MRSVRVHVKPHHAVLAAAVLLVGVVAAAQPVAPVEPDTDRAVRDVIETTRDYRQALERVLGFHVKDVERASALVDQRRELYARGIASLRELEVVERALDDARAKLAKTQQEIAQADHALAEALVAAASPSVPPSPASPPLPEPGVAPGVAPIFVRFRGAAPWSLTDTPRLDRFFREQGIEIRLAMQFDNIQMIKEAVALGSGISILPARTMQAEIEQGRLVSIPLHAPELVRPLGIVHRKRKKFNRATQSFLELLQEQPAPVPAGLTFPLHSPKHERGSESPR